VVGYAGVCPGELLEIGDGGRQLLKKFQEYQGKDGANAAGTGHSRSSQKPGPFASGRHAGAAEEYNIHTLRIHFPNLLYRIRPPPHPPKPYRPLTAIDCLQTVIHDVRKGKARRSLLDHLLGTQELLQRGGYPEALCTAGLMHSVYGTNRFTLKSIDASIQGERERVRASAGQQVGTRLSLRSPTFRMSLSLSLSLSLTLSL
jgi:hypothetical protein